MWPAGNWSRKVRENSQNSFGMAYNGGNSVALEYAVVDLHIGTRLSSNSSTLEVACPPPGIGTKFEKNDRMMPKRKERKIRN
jgi:hypothetical protein